MSKRVQVVCFLLSAALSVALYYVLFELAWEPALLLDKHAFFVLYGLVLMCLGFFLIERHFPRPGDVVVNGLAVIAALLGVGEGHHEVLRISLVWYSFVVLMLSLIVQLFGSKDGRATGLRHHSLRFLKRIAILFGNARVMFSLTFFYGIFEFHYNAFSEPRYFWFIAFWAFVMIWEPLGMGSKIESILDIFRPSTAPKQVGAIVRSMSPDIVFCQLDEDVELKALDLVQVQLKKPKSKDLFGIVLNIFFLDNVNWANVRLLDLPSRHSGSLYSKAGAILKVTFDQLPQEQRDAIDQSKIYEHRHSIIGIVDVRSTVNKIRIQITDRSKALVVGQVVYWQKQDGQSVYYQLTAGITDEDSLEEANKFGFTCAEANQLGVWNGEDKTFHKHDWVAEVNTVVYLYDKLPDGTTDTAGTDHDYLLGHIPHSDFPVFVDLNEMVPHHYSILGVTGCGKTTLELDLITKKIASRIRVLCFDITGDYAAMFDKLGLSWEKYFTQASLETLWETMRSIEVEKDKKAWEQKPDSIGKWESDIDDLLTICTKSMFSSARMLHLVELEEIANTSAVHELFQMMLRNIFHIKRAQNDGKILSIVFEEAHTIIPEKSSSPADFGKADKIVNRIAQITLQGRKYGIGFAILAQRTANVSKTILNQCNTTLSYACYDDTAKKFLANYYGDEYAAILPNLGQYQLLAAGTAVNSDLPVIVQRRKKEDAIDIIQARRDRLSVDGSLSGTESTGSAAPPTSTDDDDLPF